MTFFFFFALEYVGPNPKKIHFYAIFKILSSSSIVFFFCVLHTFDSEFLFFLIRRFRLLNILLLSPNFKMAASFFSPIFFCQEVFEEENLYYILRRRDYSDQQQEKVLFRRVVCVDEGTDPPGLHFLLWVWVV